MTSKPLSDIVCAVVRHDDKPCTSIGYRIASALIKVASLRIFSIPEQSIMELPVNSVDSYGRIAGRPSVGKFGMGFFSVFYWLIKDPELYMLVQSTYINRERQSVSYQIKISWTDGVGLSYTRLKDTPMVKRPGTEEFTTGTRIVVARDPSGSDVFTSAQKRQIREQLFRLFDIRNVRIFLIDEYQTVQLNPKVTEGSEVWINLDRKLTILDLAEGIPLEILDTNLLIPSSSSKARVFSRISVQDLEMPQILAPNPQIGLVPLASLIITVNHVVIVKVALATPGQIYLIPMLNSTRLPVARDDVVFEIGSIECYLFEEQLCRLMEYIVETQTSVKDILLLLDKYDQMSSQSGLSTLIASVKSRLYSQPNVIYVPVNSPVYKYIAEVFTQYRFIEHPYPKMFETEAQIDALLGDFAHKGMFKSRKVVKLPLPVPRDVSNGGLSEYLFVESSLFDAPECQALMIASSKTTLLIPFEGVTSEKIIQEATAVADGLRLNEQVFEVFKVVYMTWITMTQNVVLHSSTRVILRNLLMILRDLDPEDAIKLLHHYNNRISMISFDFSYGSRPNVYIRTPEAPYTPHQVIPRPPTVAAFPEGYIRNLNLKMVFWFVSTIAIKTLGSVYWYPESALFMMHVFDGALSADAVREFMKGMDLCVHEAEMFVFKYVFIAALQQPLRPDVGIFIVKEIRRRASLESLISMVTAVTGGLVTHADLNIKVHQPVVAAVRDFSSLKRDLLPTTPLEGTKAQYRFSAKSLVQYLYSTEISDETPVDEIFQGASDHYRTWDSSRLRLQIVEIAVNDGTTKEFMPAVMTELIQNSIDASRAETWTDASRRMIKINVGANGVTIEDFVGMTSRQLIPILIPFLSSKDPNDPNVTGEMGTGFFNVYRRPWSQKVIIFTSRNGVAVRIDTRPILSPGDSNMVTDIEYEVRTSKSTWFTNGTRITVIVNADPVLKSQTLTDATIFAKTYLGYTQIPMVLNETPIRTPSTQVFKTPYGTVYVANDRNLQSIILTNGIPFALLTTFCEQFPRIHRTLIDDLSIGVIIDFDKSAYTPAQSRTKVTVESGKELEIVQFINNGLFLANLHLYTRELISYPDGVIQNTSSRANVSQLKMAKISGLTSSGSAYTDIKVRDFYANYVLDPIPEFQFVTSVTRSFRFYARWPRGGSTIGDLINATIPQIQTPSGILPSQFSFGHDLVSQSLYRWFRDKNVTQQKDEKVVMVTEVVMVKSSRKARESGETIALKSPFFDHFVRTFWTIAESLVASGKIVLKDGAKLGALPLIGIGESANGYRGFYTLGTNTLLLNMEHDPAIIVPLIREAAALTPSERALQLRTRVPLLFSNSKPLVTVFHELLHAINRDEHNSMHGPPPIVVDGAKGLSFDDCGIAILNLVLASGFVEALFSTMTRGMLAL